MSCRHLDLLSWNPLELPLLPLQSFAWTSIEGEAILQADLRCIASMTTLTTLELCFLQRFRDAKPLQSFPLLQRLSLSECAKLAQQLLQPGAFPSLTELHIDDDYPEDEAGYPDLEKLYALGSKPDCLPSCGFHSS